MNDELMGLDIFFAASKSKQYRASIVTAVRTLSQFMQANGLTTRTLLAPDDEPGEKYVIRRSDLTDEGFAFFVLAEKKWFAALDRGSSPTETRSLERILSNLRKNAVAPN